jgi:hypothetical protein
MMVAYTRPTGLYQGGGYTPEEPTTTVPAPRQLPYGTSHPGVARAPGRGTVYGGQMGQPTLGGTESPLERSGSLTGAILSRGQSVRIQPPVRKRRRLRSAVVVTISVVFFLAALGGVVYLLAGDFLRALYKAITHV